MIMHASGSAVELKALQEEARACRACPLWRDATPIVFGEGKGPLMLGAV
jgi:DNA polymerase